MGAYTQSSAVTVMWDSIGRDGYPTCVGFLVSIGGVRCRGATWQDGEEDGELRLSDRG
jgi:hypothetical protein